MAYAPTAIHRLYTDIAKRIPQSELGGIVGDVNHSFGYHLARNELPGGDYSVVLPLDQQGDPGAASALDVTYGASSPLMVTVTNRLLAAARAGDARLKAMREFCGTTDGQNTHPYDLSNGQDGPLNSWDDSHLWHVHISIYRAYADDYAAIAPITDVFAGVATKTTPPAVQEDDVPQIEAPPGQPTVLDVGGCTHVRFGVDFTKGASVRAAIHNSNGTWRPAVKAGAAISESDPFSFWLGKGTLTAQLGAGDDLVSVITSFPSGDGIVARPISVRAY